jgi:hypothetical protein
MHPALRYYVHFIALALIAGLSQAEAGEQLVKENPDSQTLGVRLSFQGDTVGNNLATVLKSAYEVSPELIKPETLSVSDTDSICGILETRGYPAPCEAYFPLIDEINDAAVSKQPLKTSKPLILPGLKIATDRSLRVFSKSDVSESSKGDELLRNWKHLDAKRVDSGGNFAVQFKTYNIVIPAEDDTSANNLFDHLVAYRSKNVLVNVLTNNVNPPGALHRYDQFPDSNKIEVDCKTGDLKKRGETGLPLYRYRELMEGDQDALPLLRPVASTSPKSQAVASANTDGSTLPKADASSKTVAVVLIDTVLSGEKRSSQSLSLQNWSCDWHDFVSSQHHANHLRGIIGSEGPLNLFEGLTDHVDVTGYSWWKPADNDPTALAKGSTDRGTELADIFYDGSSAQPLPIYLAATDFDGYTTDLQHANGELTGPEKRFGRQPEVSIHDAHPLLIVAAGQSEDQGQDPIALTATTPHSPQNLGDLDNVVVVTACSACGNSPAVFAKANFSAPGQRMVHVAAPGVDPIVGWINGSSIGAAAGTSQSAALVAGLSASMISQFPDTYNSARSLKIRLQATSRPMPPLSDGTPNPDAAKLTAGIVDPVLARLDPTKHWLKQNGSWNRVKVRGWSTGYFNAVNTFGKLNTFKSMAVLRVVKTSNGIANLPPVYTIYVDALKDQTTKTAGSIDRYDFISKIVDTNLLLCNGTGIPLNKIDDLIVSSSGITTRDCISN